MKILLKSVKIIDTSSPHHLSLKDILIENGIITKINTSINEDNCQIFDKKNTCVSIGWLDMNCHVGEPGLEYREDIESINLAAANGGFTSICYMPNTIPVLDTKAQIEYVKNKSQGNLVDILPIGALSQGCNGKDLTEMYEMSSAGAVAFSDGQKSVQNGGLLERALLYAKKINGVVMNLPDDYSISRTAGMSEGVMSTQLGLEGAPKLAEEIMVARDIYIAEYTDAPIHFTAISTKKSVDLVRDAKAKGLKVTSGVNAYSLLLTDEEMSDFDTNFKVKPYLRNEEDITALINGLEDDTIDIIASGHTPLHQDEKKVEFDNALFGMSSIETCFAIARRATMGKILIEKLVKKLAIAPRTLLQQEIVEIKEGAKANLTIFNPDTDYIYSIDQNLSLSKNTPFVGKQLKGEIFGVINQTKTTLL